MSNDMQEFMLLKLSKDNYRLHLIVQKVRIISIFLIKRTTVNDVEK